MSVRSGAHFEMQIKAPGPEDCRVYKVWMIGGTDHDDTMRLVELRKVFKQSVDDAQDIIVGMPRRRACVKESISSMQNTLGTV